MRWRQPAVTLTTIGVRQAVAVSLSRAGVASPNRDRSLADLIRHAHRELPIFVKRQPAVASHWPHKIADRAPSTAPEPAPAARPHATPHAKP